MMTLFEKLTKEERAMLYKAPVYISLLAANADGTMDKKEKNEAIELTHIKSFDTGEALRDFYKEIDKTFKSDIEKLDKELPAEKEARDAKIKMELAKLENIVPTLGKEFAALFHNSLQSYKEHVSKAHRNVLEFFFIPFYIKGLTD